jgi:hypothetical protein
MFASELTLVNERSAKARERNRRWREAHADDPTFRAAKAARQRRYQAMHRGALKERRAKRRADKKAETAAQRPARAFAYSSLDVAHDAAMRRAEWRRELARLREAGLAPPARDNE